MTLNWRKHLPFELADVGSQRLTDTALALRLDLRARRRLEILALLRDLSRVSDRRTAPSLIPATCSDGT